ncbi:MAG: class I SAM-dependent methyltransferase [Candidatus Hydrogenedentes bacterium]|nr:class I SAM-dependent methyltransferase [Candidatus Hydrogenedentota bacterium]
MLRIQLYSELLNRYSIDWDVWEREVKEYTGLINKWNSIAGLVSPGDVERGCIEHIEDSLSLIDYLVPYLMDNPNLVWLDIGSGGGFPAIPILLVFKNMRIILIERKIRKSNFLQMVVKKFNIISAQVVCDGFPDCVPKYNIVPENVGIITARGVEQPGRLAKFLSNWLSPNTIFLCQSPKIFEFFPPNRFSSVKIEDNWSNLNPPLRKGALVLIRKN